MIRAFLALVAAGERNFTQLDVKTAFLNAPLDIELDVILPDGFGTRSEQQNQATIQKRRCRAITAIPGCPQGTRVWRHLLEKLAALGFKMFHPSEPCLFKNDGKDPLFLFAWVDDVFCSSPRTTQGRRQLSVFIQGMERSFPHGVKISPEGTIVHCLGLEVERIGPKVIRAPEAVPGESLEKVWLF